MPQNVSRERGPWARQGVTDSAWAGKAVLEGVGAGYIVKEVKGTLAANSPLTVVA
ncbi:MAG: hypothetical protein NVS9B14_04860 [Candidatus Acidiferrum sp.]